MSPDLGMFIGEVYRGRSSEQTSRSAKGPLVLAKINRKEPVEQTDRGEVLVFHLCDDYKEERDVLLVTIASRESRVPYRPSRATVDRVHGTAR